MAEKTEINLLKVMENGARRLSEFGQLLFAPRKSVARLVNKDGSYHVDHVQPPHGWIKHFRNTFPFLLEIKWRWILLGIGLLWPLSWTIFALVYYAIAFSYGDFTTYPNVTRPAGYTPCVNNVNQFSDMFLFSVESQQTIGYGFRYPNDGCSPLIVVLCVQYIVGAVLQGCICGIVWARLVRPKRRGQEVVFSQNAVIHQNKDGRLCFSFRISDIAGNHLVQMAVRMYMAEKKKIICDDDELFSFRLHHMNLGQENGLDRLLLLWPSLVTHVIDENSPLYGYNKSDLEQGEFEIITLVEGIVESTGLTAQTRSSYLPNEIFWGRRFQPMNFIGRLKSKVKIHYIEFENTYPSDTTDLSARQLDEISKRNISAKKEKI